MRSFFLFIGIFAFIAFIMACKKKGPETSSLNAETHNAGKSCYGCHSEVQVCGTVYNYEQASTLSNVIVKLSTTNDAKGLIKESFEVDESGNFYTNKKIELNGLFPLVVYPDGTKTQYMQSSIKSGDCNSCHQQGNRIWIE